MQKGEATHQAIIELAAQVFSKQGYAGTSMGDLMVATGLSKGAIYNHFVSKDDLALQAFDYAVGRVNERMAEAIRQAPKHAIHRLLAVVRVFQDHIEDPIFMGGCPILNTAVEADDTHPALRERAQQAMDDWHQFIVKTIRRGIQEGQVRADVDPDAIAVLMISSLEGGIMMSKLYGNSEPINRVVEYLTHYLETSVRA
jgi:AcrR family transcriptional regulator